MSLDPARRMEALADRHWRDYQARQPGTCFADPGFSLSLADAYALQAAVAALRVAGGDQVVGYKVGCTGTGTVRQFGMAGPISGRLFRSELRPCGHVLQFRDFADLAIEAEMALRIGAAGAIEAVFPVVELHHFVFRAATRTLAELVGNNGLNAGVVLPVEHWLTSCVHAGRTGVLTLLINGKQIASGDMWPLPGGIEESLRWLTAYLAQAGLALNEGDIVLAGTPFGLYPVQPGDRISVLLDDMAGTECSVV